MLSGKASDTYTAIKNLIVLHQVDATVSCIHHWDRTDFCVESANREVDIVLLTPPNCVGKLSAKHPNYFEIRNK